MIEVKYPDAEVDAAVGEADGGSVRNLHVTPQNKQLGKQESLFMQISPCRAISHDEYGPYGPREEK